MVLMRNKHDFYPTPNKIVERMAREFLDVQIAAIRMGSVRPPIPIWEPCAGDGRIADEIRSHGLEAIETDVTTGNDFFDYDRPMSPILMTNPPFSKVREFIDHAFKIGVVSMALVCSERLWACKKGREQFLRHRPGRFAMMDWREDYLGKGGSPDRALAVAIWDEPCSHICRYEVWSKDQMDIYPKFDFSSFQKN
jgi:hypothetical protein